MKVLLLAAGRSRRVKPIEDKNFLKFFGMTLIEHQLSRLERAGFKDILIIAGAHNIEQLKKIAKPFGAKVFEQKNLDDGMADAVLSVEKEVGKDDLFIVSSNDIVEVKAYESMKKALKSNADSYLLAYRVSEYFPGGYLKLSGKRITGIVEKPEPGKEPSEFINLVLHIHRKPAKLFAELKKVSSTRDDRYEVALDKLMKERNFEAVPYAGYWQPVKFPWHILDLLKYGLARTKRKIHKSAQIAKTAVINGPVVIEEGVKIFDHAMIQGPAYIGKNSVVANNALVRESMIGDRCVIGFSTEVARSFIGDDCWFHSNYVGDTVMGDDCSFGAGAICANLRLDEKDIGESGRNKLGPVLGSHIRVGVQTSLMPGIRIGSNTMITSGLTIAQDIEEGKFVSGKFEIKIEENRAKLDSGKREEMKKKL
ncbi:MAG: NTP transferase domain-containing protein [Candidatus Gracilibacteria bacterium]